MTSQSTTKIIIRNTKKHERKRDDKENPRTRKDNLRNIINDDEYEPRVNRGGRKRGRGRGGRGQNRFREKDDHRDFYPDDRRERDYDRAYHPADREARGRYQGGPPRYTDDFNIKPRGYGGDRYE